jgi:hypothetical protein
MLKANELQGQLALMSQELYNLQHPSPEDDIEFARRTGGRKDASTDMADHCAPIQPYTVDANGIARCANCGDPLIECWCGIPDCQ